MKNQQREQKMNKSMNITKYEKEMKNKTEYERQICYSEMHNLCKKKVLFL